MAVNNIPVLYTTFNRLEYTKQTLPALIDGTPEGDIYVYDNGSTDETQEWLKDLGIGNLKLNNENNGVTSAMQWLFDETKNEEWVAKVDNDTLVPEGWLTKLINAAKEANIDIIQAAHYFVINEYSSWEELEKDNNTINVWGGKVIPYNAVGGSAIVVRRSVIKEPLKAVGKIFGWWYYQDGHPEITKAFFSGVWVDLLDMLDFNKIKGSVERDYYSVTGRLP